MGARVVLRGSCRIAFAAVAVAAAAIVAPGCASKRPAPQPEPPDPRAELERHHDEYWAYLTASYDGDGDGRVARAEYGRGDEAFARLDRDRDGTVTRRDFDRDLVVPSDLVVPMLLIRLAGGPNAESGECAALRAALLETDRNGDGHVDRAEFEQAAPGGRGSMVGVDRFGTMLAGMDEDADELLSATEIERWLARRDADGNGVIVMREPTSAGPRPREGFIEPEARERAPAFTATSLADRQPVALSTLVGRKPLVLIFGSFT